MGHLPARQASCPLLALVVGGQLYSFRRTPTSLPCTSVALLALNPLWSLFCSSSIPLYLYLCLSVCLGSPIGETRTRG